MPVVYCTAYYSLVVRGRVRPGETVLIHSGSGGVGQAAIAIALSLGCRVFTTVGKALPPEPGAALPAPPPRLTSGTSFPTRVVREARVPPGQVPPARQHQLRQLPGHIVRAACPAAHGREG